MMRRLFLSSRLAALLLISVALLAVAPRGRADRRRFDSARRRTEGDQEA
jgi:hypothetical protein